MLVNNIWYFFLNSAVLFIILIFNYLFQPLDHGTDVTTLSCKEIRVEQVILFCVELPNKKTIGVKAKNNKICADILKPVLNKYGYKIDQVTMIVVSMLLY